MTRRFALVLVAALALTATAAAATGDPQYQLNAADQAWTGTLILGTEDVGSSWKADGFAGGITGADSGASSSCSLPDMSDLVLTGGTYSPDYYRSDGAYVASSAVAWQTPAQAAADWSRSLQPAVMGCLAADLQAGSTKRLKVIVVSRHQLSWPTFGERSVAYRIALVFKAHVKVKKKWRNVSAKATADFIAVGAGRARAMIWTFSFNAHPLSDLSKQKWAMLLAQRMASPPAQA
jgi:hypothetical protein